MNDAVAVFVSLLDGLRGRLLVEAEVADSATFNTRLAHSADLARAGEGGVGLEDLCENLYEFGVPITPDERRVLTELAADWRAAESTADVLSRLASRDE